MTQMAMVLDLITFFVAMSATKISKRSPPLWAESNEEGLKQIIMIRLRCSRKRKEMFDNLYKYLETLFQDEDISFSDDKYVLQSVVFTNKYERFLF